ncbi:MAG: hypothetical protein OES24_21085 [Acidimicrobiia bacterium]|nr:hypothetical protein [Acidimicrobiia bacterium]
MRPTGWLLATVRGELVGFVQVGSSDRARRSLDRHATYIVATFVAGASR